MVRTLTVAVNVTMAGSLLLVPSTESPAADAAKDYPVRPIRMVIAQTPGSSIDAMGRVLATKMSELLGQQVVVDNRTGAGGTLGAGIVAHAEPDGYTILGAATASQVIGPHLYKSLVNYDPFRDFAPVSMFAVTQNILAVHAQTPFRTVKDLLAHAREKPGTLNWANAGSGFQSHLAGVLFTHMANIKVLHVPYKGAGASLTSVVAGESHVTIVPAPSVVGHLNAGRLRALAMGGDKRSPQLPNLPTISESGVPGYTSNGWAGIVVPAKTSAAIQAKLLQAMHQANADKVTHAAMIKLGAEPMASSGAEFAAVIKRDWQSFGEAIRVSGIQAN